MTLQEWASSVLIPLEYTVTCLSDYRWILDWWSDLLDSFYTACDYTHMCACTCTPPSSSVHSHVLTSCCSVVTTNGVYSLPLCLQTVPILSCHFLIAEAHNNWNSAVL
jgi:hypothetical protein